MFVRMYVRMYLCMYVCMYVRTYVCTYVSMYVCMFVRMYVCMYVHTYVRMCVHTYVFPNYLTLTLSLIFHISPIYRLRLSTVMFKVLILSDLNLFCVLCRGSLIVIFDERVVVRGILVTSKPLSRSLSQRSLAFQRRGTNTVVAVNYKM